MPYANNAELPPAVRKLYSDRCQSVFRKAFNAVDGPEATAFKIAHTAARNCMDATSTTTEVKAQMVGNDHFRVLAIPFGGPLGGRDLDGEFFTKRTDIKPDWFAERPVLWHHGQDSLMGDETIGKADGLTLDEDGWWVDVWVKHGDRRADLFRRVAEKAPIYGSSGTVSYLKKASHSGEILVWPYIEQTLTTSPQNNFSVVKPAKAVLDDFESADIRLDAAVKAFLEDIEQAHRSDLAPTSTVGEATAMAGLAAAEAAFSEALRELRER
jgi:cation transport regulator ChaB